MPPRVPAGCVAEVREECSNAYHDLRLVEIEFLLSAFERARFVGRHVIKDGARTAMIRPVSQHQVLKHIGRDNEPEQKQDPPAYDLEQALHGCILPSGIPGSQDFGRGWKPEAARRLDANGRAAPEGRARKPAPRE